MFAIVFIDCVAKQEPLCYFRILHRRSIRFASQLLPHLYALRKHSIAETLRRFHCCLMHCAQNQFSLIKI